jgi:peptide methionine sulfoxide reductase MsrB
VTEYERIEAVIEIAVRGEVRCEECGGAVAHRASGSGRQKTRYCDAVCSKRANDRRERDRRRQAK